MDLSFLRKVAEEQENKLKDVSILVLMDLSFLLKTNKNTNMSMNGTVSILVLMDLSFLLELKELIDTMEKVSILVLMDLSFLRRLSA